MKIHTLSIILLLFFVFSCSKKETVSPEAGFSRIYDNAEFGGSYYPVDVIQTSDGGYLILSELKRSDTDFFGVYILKTDSQGNFLWAVTGPDNLVNPIPGLVAIGESYYFMCMDRLTLATNVMQINDNSAPTAVQTYGSIIYPLHASATPDGGALLLSYDRALLSTRITKMDSRFNISWQRTYTVFENPEKILVEHLTRTGRRLPFFTGTVGDASASGYFYNGFDNFSFSMRYISASDGTAQGVVNGFRINDRYSAAITSNVFIASGKFAISRINQGISYISPFQDISTSAILVSTGLKGNQTSEISDDSKVVVKKLAIGSKSRILYASNTKNNQLVVYAYDAETGNLLGTRYFGSGNPYEISNFTQTKDGGLAILSSTLVAGRFPRIAIFKIAKSELEAFAK
jgi:hypothetical protein